MPPESVGEDRRGSIPATAACIRLAVWLGVVGTALQLFALYVGPIADDYRRAFWLEVIGSLLGSWAWRIYKAAKWT